MSGCLRIGSNRPSCGIVRAACLGSNVRMMIHTTRNMLWVVALVIAGCASDSGHETDSIDYTRTVKSADAAVIEKWQRENISYVVLDVRSEREYEEDGRVPGSVLQPYSFDNKKKGQNEAFLEGVSKRFGRDERIVVLCSHGMRATQATAELGEKAGFTNVYVFPGGVEGHHMSNYPGGDGWLAAGLPYEK